MTEPTLFDAATEAREARDEAIGRVEEHADPRWTDTAARIVVGMPRASVFTTDDVWAALAGTDATTHEPRALGAVMIRLAREGFIHKTGSYRPSTRKECHARPIPVWARTTLTPVTDTPPQ